MRTDLPQPIRLAEYAPYPFAIESVALDFDLTPDRTLVFAKMQVVRTGPVGTPMFLNGEALKLISISVNGAALDAADYVVTDTGLTLTSVPDRFTLQTQVEIAPEKNTALSGLYISGGRICTQCEAEGFRRITYWPDRPDVMSRFHVTLTADKAAYPILLSNGTPGKAGDTADGRHFAIWDDPHPKPSYLFALCAGDYDVHRDTFTTMSGNVIDLAVHVDKGEAHRAGWAMDSLKRSMRWDEEVFGREYDLGVFNIVAVRDFNFGAMENKGLNIFNSSYVLADEQSATDFDFEAIESIVGHEYFHNWTGNRITCRDWFQLCLKEGLTVFRDQEFSADMRSRKTQRVKDVAKLRGRQFAEDAGPLAHPVRPDHYASIDNLYTATVYDKGAELIRMLKTLIGERAFKAGMDLYFIRHDGSATTIEAFLACFEESAGQSLNSFALWYAQPGTPKVSVARTYDDKTRQLTLSLAQSLPATSAHGEGKPVPITLRLAAFAPDGKKLALKVEGEAASPAERIVVLEAATATLVLDDMPEGALISINRGFSAPVKVSTDQSVEELATLASVDDDAYIAWDCLRSLARDTILETAQRLRKGERRPQTLSYVAAAKGAFNRHRDDPAFAAMLLQLPDLNELVFEMPDADPEALHLAREALQAVLAFELEADLISILETPMTAAFRPDAQQAGLRALRSMALTLLASRDEDHTARLVAAFDGATNMTDSMAALGALSKQGGDSFSTAVSAFYDRWKDNPLVIDKWFALQARAPLDDALERAIALKAHPDFAFSNPNRVRSLAFSFAAGNLRAFHKADGSGYRFLADIVKTVDPLNPALSARLLTSFESWRRFDGVRRTQAERVLRDLLAGGLSPNAADIVNRALQS